MLPKVIIYNSISLDGRINFFNTDSSLYHEIASKWNVDAVLMGSNTLRKEFNPETGELNSIGNDEVEGIFSLPLLVVPDSGGQIRIWDKVLEMPFIKDILVLCSRSTPQEYMNLLDQMNIKYMVVGYSKVNLGTALEELNTQFGVKSIYVYSGGTLNGVLLREDLVDEVCVLLNPVMVGGISPNSIYTAPDLKTSEDAIDLKLIKMEKLKNEIIFLQYRVMKYQF